MIGIVRFFLGPRSALSFGKLAGEMSVVLISEYINQSFPRFKRGSAFEIAKLCSASETWCELERFTDEIRNSMRFLLGSIK